MADGSDAEYRKTLVVGIAVVLFLVACVAVAATRAPAEPSSSAAAGRSQEQPAADKDSTSTALPSVSFATSQPPAGVKPGTRPVRIRTKSKVKAIPPELLAAQGSRLTTISSAPPQTMGFVALPEGFDGARFQVTFRPYGWSPAGPGSNRLVVRISSATPADEGSRALGKDLADRNTILTCSPTSADSIRTATEYSGVIEIQQRGDVGFLYLTEVHATH